MPQRSLAACDDCPHHLRRRAKCRRAFRGVENRQAAAGSRADVDKRPASCERLLTMASTARAIFGSSRRTASATRRIFAVQHAQNFERGLCGQARASADFAVLSLQAFKQPHLCPQSIIAAGEARISTRRAGFRSRLCRGSYRAATWLRWRDREPRKRRRAARGAPGGSCSFSRVGFTRLVSRMTNSSRSGSIQSDVPVKPVVAKALAARNSDPRTRLRRGRPSRECGQNRRSFGGAVNC